MMRSSALVSAVLLLLLAACAGKSEPKQKPLSVPGEKVYTMEGKIVSRDSGDNTLNIDHKAIAGFMEAMAMDYSVRGANVKDLPPDGTAVTAKLHVTDDAFWVTEVRKLP